MPRRAQLHSLTWEELPHFTAGYPSCPLSSSLLGASDPHCLCDGCTSVVPGLTMPTVLSIIVHSHFMRLYFQKLFIYTSCHFIFERTNYESLCWMKHFSLRLAVINVCPVLVPSELLLSTHLPTSERWTAKLTSD